MSKYNEKFDYVAAHLQWIRDHPKFESKEHSVANLGKVNNVYFEKPSYIETMTEWYTTSDSPFLNKIAYLNYKDDLKWMEESKQINLTLTKKDFETNVAFVTIGFNHQEFTISKAFELIKSILNSDKVLDGSFAVMENYRENGIHPHVHMKIYYSGSTYKSMLIQTMYRSKNAKKLILSKNFIDIKEFQPYHEEYLQGNKKENKIKYVEMDKNWREINKIPHIIYKDTSM